MSTSPDNNEFDVDEDGNLWPGTLSGSLGPTINVGEGGNVHVHMGADTEPDATVLANQEELIQAGHQGALDDVARTLDKFARSKRVCDEIHENAKNVTVIDRDNPVGRYIHIIRLMLCGDRVADESE